MNTVIKWRKRFFEEGIAASVIASVRVDPGPFPPLVIAEIKELACELPATTGVTADDDSLPLCRLRYLGSPDNWGFAIYLANDSYEHSILPAPASPAPPKNPSTAPAALPNDITAWTEARQPDREDSRENL